MLQLYSFLLAWSISSPSLTVYLKRWSHPRCRDSATDGTWPEKTINLHAKRPPRLDSATDVDAEPAPLTFDLLLASHARPLVLPSAPATESRAQSRRVGLKAHQTRSQIHDSERALDSKPRRRKGNKREVMLSDES
jgi:hypothetical protein